MELIPLYQGKRKNILVISGGALKGLSALGALKYLIESEIIIYPDIFCGTSVGSIICFLICIGYGPTDIYNILEQIDFTSLINYIDPEHIIFDPCLGISTLEPMIHIICSFMKKKNIPKNITFKELFEKTQSKLIITGTCINDSTITYFSIDTYPNMEIIKAIQISISIPFMFKPFKFDNKLWIDGGCINNFPIDLFCDKLDDVIGIYLDDCYDYQDEINEIQEYFYRVIKCFNRGFNFDKLKLYKKYYIHIIIDSKYTIHWEMTTDEKKMLFDHGYDSAKNFINL